MIWAFGGLLLGAAIVVAGRIHSRHLDELDRKWLELGDQKAAAELASDLARHSDQNALRES